RAGSVDRERAAPGQCRRDTLFGRWLPAASVCARQPWRGRAHPVRGYWIRNGSPMNSTQRDRPEAKVVDSRRLYMRLLACVRPYWKLFAVAIIGMVVTGLSEPAMPALIKPLLDNTFVDKDPEWIRLMPLLLIGLFVV